MPQNLDRFKPPKGADVDIFVAPSTRPALQGLRSPDPSGGKMAAPNQARVRPMSQDEGEGLLRIILHQAGLTVYEDDRVEQFRQDRQLDLQSLVKLEAVGTGLAAILMAARAVTNRSARSAAVSLLGLVELTRRLRISTKWQSHDYDGFVQDQPKIIPWWYKQQVGLLRLRPFGLHFIVVTNGYATMLFVRMQEAQLCIGMWSKF